MILRIYTPWPHGSGIKLLMELESETAPAVFIDQDTRKGDPFRVFIRAGKERADGGMVFPQEESDPTNVIRYVESTYLFADVPETPRPT